MSTSPTPFSYSSELATFLAPVQTLLSTTYTSLDGLAVGALIFSPHTSRLLLLRRAPTDTSPRRWEVPGGGCDDTDETILHSVAREVKEETGLTVKSVERCVAQNEFVTTRRRLRVRKFEFIVTVSGVEGGEGEAAVKTDPSEHDEARWCSLEEVKEMEITSEGHRRVLVEAFERWLKGRNSQGGGPVTGV